MLCRDRVFTNRSSVGPRTPATGVRCVKRAGVAAETSEKVNFVPLTTEAVARLRPGDDLYSAIRNFRSLPVPAGERAARWLRDRLAETHVPIQTHLRLDPAGKTTLGFYAVRPISFELSKRDFPLLQVRRMGVQKEPQPALLLSWIARTLDSGQGSGRPLFLHATANAIANGFVALIIEPDDERTKQVWISKYRCMEAQDGSGRLWYPVDRPTGGGWPS